MTNQQISAAVVQMNSSLDKQANLNQAEQFLKQAAQAGSELIVLPELFNAYGPLPQVVQQAEPIPGPTSEQLSAWAARWGVYLCGGSLAEAAEPGWAYNTSLFFDPTGALIGKYRKMHRFDVDLNETCVSRESDVMLAGDSCSVTTTSRGIFAQAICYDLRFPELFRQLSSAGAEIILFPSAFTAFTGQDHWEPLVRARAIENQAFFLAANQVGNHGDGLSSWGHSTILDPWGRSLAELDQGPGIACAKLDMALLNDLRSRLPALKHRKI